MVDTAEVLDKLSLKIDDLLARYEALREHNETLARETVSLQAQNELKNAQIEKLEVALQGRVREAEEIFTRIDAVLER